MAIHRSPRVLLAAVLLAAACGEAAAPAPAPAETPDPAAPAPEPVAPRPADEWKFDFKDPPAGPRAPVTAAFGATIGTSMFAEIEAHVAKLGLKCGDTSIRAMMDRRREVEKAKVADARARGEDAVTAASWVNRRSKREANPQLRFSCPKIRSEQITDRAREPSEGRLLYVFDDAQYPLRHASYQRTHKDHAAALKDYEETLAALTKIYGPPSKAPRGELPRPDKDGKVEFPGAVNFETAWEFADLVARVNVLRYGELVTVGERVEVPHGLRPDAPRFAAGAPAAAPADPAAAAKPQAPAAAPAAPAPAAG